MLAIGFNSMGFQSVFNVRPLQLLRLPGGISCFPESRSRDSFLPSYR